MEIELNTVIKPLVANLRGSNLGQYLCTKEFDNLMLAKDYDQIWMQAKKEASGSSSGYISTIQRTRKYQSAFELLLDTFFIKEKDTFHDFLHLVLVDFIEWGSNVNMSKLLVTLESLDMPIPYVDNIEQIFKTTEQLNLTKDHKSPVNKKLTATTKNEIFIVHGHDELARIKTASFIERLGFKPIILHEQASSGNTIIEKIEEHTNVGFGIVLYTPCDLGGKTEDSLKARARQNVVFEHGYLIGKIGRKNVCALVKGDIEIPNDISGVVYVKMDDEDAWHIKIAKELRNSGYNVDMNKL